MVATMPPLLLREPVRCIQSRNTTLKLILLYGKVIASVVARSGQVNYNLRAFPYIANHNSHLSLKLEMLDHESGMPLATCRMLAFVGDVYEDLELWYPKLRLIEEGCTVTVAGPAAGHVYEGKNGYPCRSDVAIADCVSTNFDALLVPGGFMPDKLRRDPKVLSLVQEFDRDSKPIAAICHGGWIPISANVYRGVRVTGSPGIKDDLINAGGLYEDASVVVDGHHVSSRRPDDLPDFCRALIALIIAENEA